MVIFFALAYDKWHDVNTCGWLGPSSNSFSFEVWSQLSFDEFMSFNINCPRVEGGSGKTTIFRNAHKRYKYLFNINNRAVQTRTVRLADSRGMRNNVFGTEAAPDTTTFATSSRYYVTRYILSRKLVLRARVFFARSPQLECHYGNTKSNCALL